MADGRMQMKDKNCLKIGIRWKRALLGVLCLLIVGVLVQMSDGMEASGSSVWFAVVYLLGLTGVGLFLDGCVRTYRVDHKGITTYYFKLFNFFVPWEDCAYIGMEKKPFLHFVCIKNKGQYALNIPYDEKIHREIKTYLPDFMSIELWKGDEKQKPTVTDATQWVLRDTEGEMVIDVEKRFKNDRIMDGSALIFLVMFAVVFGGIGALIKQSFTPVCVMMLLVLVGIICLFMDYQYYGRNIIINREGITTVSVRTQKRRFYAWQEFDRIGIYYPLGRGTGDSKSGRAVYLAGGVPGYGFWICCRTRRLGFSRRIMIEYTKKRYEQFLTYVPEGALTDPLTQKFEIEWMKRVKNNKTH